VSSADVPEEFQMVGAATEKLCRPSSVLVRGTNQYVTVSVCTFKLLYYVLRCWRKWLATRVSACVLLISTNDGNKMNYCNSVSESVYLSLCHSHALCWKGWHIISRFSSSNSHSSLLLLTAFSS